MATGVRGDLVTLMKQTVEDEHARHLWTYNDSRPRSVPPSWKPGQKVTGDCSKGVQYLCRWARAPDPMGNGFATWGNSASIATHLRHASDPSLLKVGDCVTFGPGGNQHAAMVYQAGADPMLWSFGHQGAPNFYRLSSDGREHQLLKLGVPDPKPTPRERLRSRTGYWAWVSWFVGEGEWKKYGHLNPTVRPNVPQKISPGWWAQLAAFEAARHKGNPPTK